MAFYKNYIKCNHGDYMAPISNDYGIPEPLVDQCIAWHETAHKGHKVNVYKEGSDK